MNDSPTSLLTAPSTRVAGKIFLAVVAVICVATSPPPPVPPPNVPMWSIASQRLTLPCGTADVWVSKSGKTGMGITVRITPTRQGAAVADPTPSEPDPAGRPSQVAVDPATNPTSAPIAVGPDGRNLPIPQNAPLTIVASPSRPPIDPACHATVGATLTFPDRSFTGKRVVEKRSTELQAEERQRRAEYLTEVEARGVPDPTPLDATYYYVAFELDNEERWNRGDRSATLELSIDLGGYKHDLEDASDARVSRVAREAPMSAELSTVDEATSRASRR